MLQAAKIGAVFLVLLGGGTAAVAQQRGEMPRGARRFPQLDWLVGEWRGFGKFTNTASYITKKFSYDVGGIFLTERTVDVFPPAEPSTDFEIHQDLIVYYRNGDNGPFRAKGFYVESFVSSMHVTVSNGGDSITLETTQVENAPPGMRSRVTYTRKSPDEFRGTFELAKPDEPYIVVEQLTMKRVH